MNIVFMGTPAFSVPILKALHEHYGVRLVVTQPDSPVGRKKTLTSSPVKTLAQALGIDVFQPGNIRKDYGAVLDAKPDIIITAAYGQIIPKVLLEAPLYGAINVHASLLPALRGGAPIQRAIERRQEKTGVTVMMMSEQMDAGDILTQRETGIAENETAGTLFAKLSILGRDLLIDTLPSLIAGTADKIPQDPSRVSFAYNIKRAEEKLDFNMSMFDLDAKIRAFHPGPNTFTQIGDQKLKVIEARPHVCQNFTRHHETTPNGTVIAFFDDGIGVKCADGALVLRRVQLAGKKALTAPIFMQGAGRTLLKKGVILDETA